MKCYKTEQEFLGENLGKIFVKEDLLQEACFFHSWQFRPETRRCIWHVPNGGDRRKVQALQFKAMGVIPGVCDMHFNWASQLYIIELKVCANAITDAQEQYIKATTTQGAIFYECRTVEKWICLVDRILKNTPMPCEANRLVKFSRGWKVDSN